MSKKVVHLADEAHELAKEYCKTSGIKMSDWVALLIRRAVTGEREPAPPPQQQQQRQHVAPPAPQPVRSQPQQHVAHDRHAHDRHAHDRHAHDRHAHDRHAHDRHAPHGMSDADKLRGALVPKKKSLLRAEVKPQQGDDGVPAYAQPPFWSRAKG